MQCKNLLGAGLREMVTRRKADETVKSFKRLVLDRYTSAWIPDDDNLREWLGAQVEEVVIGPYYVPRSRLV